MPSPFPGMDPYLESHWLDVHTTLVADARRALNRLLPAGLVARVEERVAIESTQEVQRHAAPDVRVFTPSVADEGTGGVAIKAPFKLVLELDPLIERFIRILDEGGQLITVVEFISPTNKRQPGLNDYLEKRAGLLSGGVHVVEIDLVRGGNWRALMRPAICPPAGVSPWRATIWTGGPRRAAYLYPIHLREPLPAIAVPLRASDPPVQLPLQPLIAGVYDDGRYDETVDYNLPPDPPLEPEEAAWAEALLKGTGRQ